MTIIIKIQTYIYRFGYIYILNHLVWHGFNGSTFETFKILRGFWLPFEPKGTDDYKKLFFSYFFSTTKHTS